MPTVLDHALALLLVIVLPVYAAVTYRQLLRGIREGGTEARMTEYRRTMAAQWGLAAVAVAVWWIRGRALADLGLTVPGDVRSAAGAAVVLAGMLFLAVQWRGILRLTPAREASLRAQLAVVAELLPRTEREGMAFNQLAVTAGICEEILYRGFLIWYVTAFVGPWPAVAITAAVFGAAHFYQGVTGVTKTGLVGAFAGALYVATGSLLWPMVLHVAVDLQGGAVARRVLGANGASGPAT